MKSYYPAKQSCALIASFSLTCNLHAAVVFQTGFDYANTPTLTTDGASVNGATGQIGSFSGTMNGPTLTSGGALQMDVPDLLDIQYLKETCSHLYLQGI